MISGEIEKGRWVYYSCTGGRGKCEQKHVYLREEVIEKQVVEALSKIKTSEVQKEWITATLKNTFADEQKWTQERTLTIKRQVELLSDRINKLYIDKLDGNISDEFWSCKHNGWSQEKLNLEIKLEALNKSNKNFIEEGVKFLNICTRINELYVLADVNQKQKLINYCKLT